MKEQQIINAYEIAKERYAKLGIDTDAVMETLQSVPMSMHCWQADDVTGFESQGSLTGGIQATGNYPGKARNIEELRADILKAASYVPGKHRLNLHEIYGEFGGQFVDRDQVEVKHFEGWMQWSKENDMKLSTLAKLTFTSAPNLSNKLKRNNISETDLRTLAYALGYDVEITLINRETKERV